jgi:hypothetical protein
VPAYEAEPRGGGAKILVGIGLAALVIGAGFVGYKIFGGNADVKDSFARFDKTSPSRVEAPRTPPAAAPTVAKEATPETAPTAPPSVPESAKADEKAQEKAPPKADAQKASGADADKARSGTPGTKSDAKGTPKGAPGAGTLPAVTPATPPPSPAARPAPPVAAPPPAPAPVQDRWAQMSDELQHCQKENLFNRIVCDQRVRLRFCDGYWGKVSQCPGNVVNPDRGQ